MTYVNNKQVRTLSYNEMSSLMAEKISPHNCVICIKFEGIIDKKIINQALMFIKKLFPCLTASIKKLHSNKYFFKFNNDINIPFREISVKNTSINHYIENEINTSFNLLKGPLIRLTRISANSDQWLLFTVHHTVSDGISIQYYIKHFFKIISFLVTTKTDLCFIPHLFHKTEQIVKLHKDFFKKTIIPNRKKFYRNSFELNKHMEKSYTKINNFSINLSDKFQDFKNITSILLSTLSFAMQAVFPTTKNINFVLPVNLRTNMIHPKLGDAIGFHCSWIDFIHVLDKTDTVENVKKLLRKKIEMALKNQEHIINFMKLRNIIDEPEGIIKNISTTAIPSICVSHVGELKIPLSYASNTIKLHYAQFGLSSYFRTENSFLLISSYTARQLHLQLLHASPYFQKEKAIYLKQYIKRKLQCALKP